MPTPAAPPMPKKSKSTTPPTVPPVSIGAALVQRREAKRAACRTLWELARAEVGGTSADGNTVLQLLEAAGFVSNGEPDCSVWESWIESAARIEELKPIAARLDGAQKALDQFRRTAQDLIIEHRQARRHAAELRASISATLKREGTRGADIARRKAELLAEVGKADLEVARLAAALQAARDSFHAFSRGEWWVAARAASELKDCVPPEAR